MSFSSQNHENFEDSSYDYCPLHMVLCEPEIPGNVGTLLRLQQCWGFSLHLIGPLGFLLSEASFRRAHLDYHKNPIGEPSKDFNKVCFHKTWTHYRHFFFGDSPNNKENQTNIAGDLLGKAELPSESRFIVVSPEGKTLLPFFQFQPGDHIVFGSESKGLPSAHWKNHDASLRIPMKKNCRSLNLALCGGIVLGKAMADLNWPGI